MERRIKQLDRLSSMLAWLMAIEVVGSAAAIVGVIRVGILDCLGAAFACYAGSVICKALADVLENQQKFIEREEECERREHADEDKAASISGADAVKTFVQEKE